MPKLDEIKEGDIFSWDSAESWMPAFLLAVRPTGDSMKSWWFRCVPMCPPNWHYDPLVVPSEYLKDLRKVGNANG